MKFLSLFLFGFLVSCSNYGQLTFVAKLPKKIKESSGITSLTDKSVWIIEDNGNHDKIFEVDLNGKILKELKVKGAKNRDWEDLTKDDKGNVYIADTGNNANKRDDLVIYKIPNPELEKGDKIRAEEIRFNYPEQKRFPPKKDSLFFDSEALFYFKDKLYIITKNRATPFTGKALVYKLPSKKGTYNATYIGSFTPCTTNKICRVTAADVSPDGKKIALLGYGKLWVFTDFEMENFTTGKMETIDLGATTQLESLCFKNNNTLYLADEQSAHTGRNLYTYTLD
ncbi:hypothetical protein [Spongiimicrobium sp. 3-5]|uniref:hypothetical protein n=1 Tax=Spongiimicrobium sp. 3-5 TaxID=3332596 RepID=UPI00397FC6A6